MNAHRLILAAALAAVLPARADTFFPISSVTSATAGTDFFPAARLIEGPGVGFGALEPHNRTSTLTWVTNAPNGGAGDYFEPLPTPSPRLVFDLGQNRKLSEISAWGYADGNGNGARDITLRFATEAEGPAGFGASIAYSPSFTLIKATAPRQSFSFNQVVEARYVEVVPTDNFFGIEPPGGDRVGLGEVAFEDRAIATNPTLDVAATVNFFANAGATETFSIRVSNTGLNPLTISGGAFSGPQAAAFSLQTLPPALGVLEEGNVVISVNPAGQPNLMEATLQISSNDPTSPKSVIVRVQKPSTFYPITSVTGTTQGTDLFFEANLIQGAGVGFDALAPHNQLPGGGDVMLWVTNAPNGATGDYFSPLPTPAPVFVFDLGEDRLLGEISVWGYSTGNANGVKDFALRFATAADGVAGMGTSITFAPQYVLPFGAAERHSFSFGRIVRARYVELTPLDNYFGTGVAPGGDRAGLGEVAFETVPAVDPRASAPASVAVTTSGTPVTGTFELANLGATQVLNVTSVAGGGANGAALTIQSFPATVAPGATGSVAYTFTPGSISGTFDTTALITTNDPLNPVTSVRFTGVVRNPELVVAGAVTAGPLAPGVIHDLPVSVENRGASNNLTLTNVAVTGADAARFTILTNPSPVSAGATAPIVLRFDPAGRDGVFRAALSLTTNDPLRPSVTLPITVSVTIVNPLVAWWPLDIDGRDASGNGHDGVATGLPVNAPGATSATAGSIDFDGFTRFSVPYSPALNPQSFTVTFWARPEIVGGAFASPITSRDDVAGGVQTHGYLVYINPTSNWTFWTGDGNPGWDVLDGPFAGLEQWTHVAITYNALTNTKTLYLDGMEAAVTTAIATPRYSPNGTTEQHELHIGAGGDLGDSFWFDGQLDDIALFRDALPATAIQAIRENGVSGYLNPPAAFRILSVTRPTPTSVTLTFESVAGASYVVQRATGLSGWQDQPGTVVGLAGSTTWTDTTPPAGEPKVFYRVRRTN